MKILTKYTCIQFIKLLALCHFVFLAIYLTIDFIQKVDNFIDAGTSADVVLAYFFYKIPYIMIQMVPVTVILAAILTFCFMEKNNEITAMKACGISIFRLSIPIIYLSIIITGAVFLFSEFVVPIGSKKSNEIWNNQIKKDSKYFFYGQKHIWYRGKNVIYGIDSYDPKNRIMRKATFYFFDDSFSLVKRIDAQKGVWERDRWKLYDGIIQNLVDSEIYGMEPFKTIDLEIPEGPDAFVKNMRSPEEMSYWELKQYAEDVSLEGYDATRYIVDMNIKMAFPFVNFIMILLGIPIALISKRGGTPLAVSIGIVACFFYLVVFGFSRSFGLSQILPPVISAWLANFVFFFLGSYMFMRVDT